MPKLMPASAAPIMVVVHTQETITLAATRDEGMPLPAATKSSTPSTGNFLDTKNEMPMNIIAKTARII